MKKYTIELNDDLSAIYKDIAKYNQKPLYLSVKYTDKYRGRPLV